MTIQKRFPKKNMPIFDDMRKKSVRIVMFSIILLSILIVFWFCGVKGPDWEVLTTKHYWKADQWYYGGYASQFVETPNGYRTIQRESLGNYLNLYPFNEKSSPSQAQYQVAGYPSTERLAIPFLVYLIINLSRGYLDVWSAFYFLNLVLWLYSIFLAYQIASIFFEDQYSPFIAALLVTFFPVFTLNFHGLKMPYISTVLLLAGVFIFEKHIRHMQVHLQFIYFSVLFFFGLFAVGGWLFLFVYLLIWHFNLLPLQRWRGITSMILALLAAQAALLYLRMVYHLPSAEQQVSLSYVQVLSDSMKWLWIWMHGQDVGKLIFFNYPGFTLFTGYLPLIVNSFIRSYWMFLLLSIPAWIFVRQARIFLQVSIPLFFTAHGAYMVTGWIWHYGYLSAPAGMMLMISTAGFLGWMFSRPQLHLKKLAVVFLIIALIGFTMDQKLNAGIYYGGFIERFQSRVILHYGEGNDITEY